MQHGKRQGGRLDSWQRLRAGGAVPHVCAEALAPSTEKGTVFGD